MDIRLVTVIFLGIFVGYNAQPAGSLNFACRDAEEYDMCRSPCEPTCNSIRSGLQVNCTQSCVAGCFCKTGLVRAIDRSCILPEECARRDIRECRENEEYLECGSPCSVNCSTINDPIFCTKPCHSGCFCKPDYIRDSNGNCVHPRNCFNADNTPCPTNEHFVSCVNYCNTCWENPDCRIPECNPGCDCKPGFYRNYFGQCVTFQECLARLFDTAYPGLPSICGENEFYSDCMNMCNDCDSRGRCNYEYYCEPGCDCRPGYFRDETGVCVTEQFCFRRCRESQVFSSCGPSCVSTCQNYKRLLYDPCKQDCVPGCFCPRNFVLGPGGRCIEPKFCPPERPACPPDEQYYVCIPTCHATCDTFNDSTEICDISCTKGCFCKGGLIRRNDGKCVLPRDCPARNPTCPPGEAFYQCLPTCRTTCETLNVSNGLCSTECVSGCFCQPGFVRNRYGKCVRPNECSVPIRPSCPPGEVHFNCIPCRNTCESLKSTKPCVRICRPGCSCRKGLVRNRNGRCVRPRSCLIDEGTGNVGGRRKGADDDGSTEETTTSNPTTVANESTTSISTDVNSHESNSSVPRDTAATTEPFSVASDAPPATTLAADTTMGAATTLAATTINKPTVDMTLQSSTIQNDMTLQTTTLGQTSKGQSESTLATSTHSSTINNAAETAGTTINGGQNMTNNAAEVTTDSKTTETENMTSINTTV